MSATRLLEIACFNLSSALIAQVSGANRIELCEHYREGGLTPSYKLIQEARQKIQIPLHVIIRPRAGDFCYSEEEVAVMKNDILFCKAHHIEGVVLGVLNGRKQLNEGVCHELISLARPMSVTFHRAVDHCSNYMTALEMLVRMEVDRVLTSGGTGNADTHIDTLRNAHSRFGRQIILMPGGGIRSSNIKALKTTQCPEFHSAAITGHEDMADAAEIRSLRQLLDHS